MNIIRILCDLDEVCTQFLKKLCNEYNQQYNKNLQPHEIDQWDLTKFIGLEGKKIFEQPGFFIDLEIYPHTREVLEELNCKHELLICSKPQNSINATEKYIWVENNLPFIKFNQIILGSHKHLIEADVMIDDYTYYLNNFTGRTICVDRPYNKDCNADFRVKDWIEIKEIIDILDECYPHMPLS